MARPKRDFAVEQIPLRLAVDLAARLRAYAAESGQPINTAAGELLDRALKVRGK